MTTTPGQPTETTPDSSPDSLADLADLPGFAPWSPRNPPHPQTGDPLDPDSTTTSAPADDAAKADIPTSIPAFFRSRAKSYGAIAGALLQATGGWINGAVARADDIGDAFLPDDDDVEAIAPPLGRIAARRIKVGSPDNLTDVEDMFTAAIGITVWLAKGVTATLTARRARRAEQGGRAVYHDPEQGT